MVARHPKQTSYTQRHNGNSVRFADMTKLCVCTYAMKIGVRQHTSQKYENSSASVATGSCGGCACYALLAGSQASCTHLLNTYKQLEKDTSDATLKELVIEQHNIL